MEQQFVADVNAGYDFKGDHVTIGTAMLDGKLVEGANVDLPFRTMNRHGLIAGATGTGKTKTLQVLAESLSDASIPVLLLDIKGDLTGIAMPGSAEGKISERIQQLKIDFTPSGFPVELLTLSNEKGVRLRATVTEFGPILISKILGLNDTQAGLMAILFKYSDDNALPLVDLKDLTKLLQFAGNEGKKELEANYGKISTTSSGTILRKVIELQQQGADIFFGEPSFEIDDLMRISDDGRGVISILRVTDMQDRPKLFSTFLLQLMAELYASCPEEGDLDKPKFVMFIDEAHLVFDEASQALLDQIETIIKLIRSKGIGIFFCTQNPQDIPAPILSQLGLKVQHALRAFTAADRKVIKQAAENFPETKYYETDELLTQMGIGEAFITLLNEKGIPTPLVHTMLVPPRSRMGILNEAELDEVVKKSKLADKYNRQVDNETAYEILTKKLSAAKEEEETKETSAPKRAAKEETILDNPILRQAGRTAASVLTRSLLGALGLSGRRSSRRRSLF